MCSQAAVGESRSLNLEVFSAGTGTYLAVLYSHAASAIVATAEYTILLPLPQTTPDPGYNQPGPDGSTPAPVPPPPPPGTIVLESVAEDTGFTAHGGLSQCPFDGGKCEFVYSDSSSVYIPGRSVQSPPVLRCGDGRWSKEGNEQCDDGRNEDGDGCNSTCFVETGWNCTVHPIPQIEYDEQTGLYHTVGPGGDSRCARLPHCGDGKRNVVGEECDDGNLEDGDGCSAKCRVEGGWECALDDETNPGQEVCTGVVELNFDKRGCPECHAYGECVLFAGLERCRCKPGFAQDQTNPGFPNPMISAAELADSPQVCQDIDECWWASLSRRNLCEHASLACINTPGSFSCSCEAGMEFISADRDDPDSTALCVDVSPLPTLSLHHRTLSSSLVPVTLPAIFLPIFCYVCP